MRRLLCGLAWVCTLVLGAPGLARDVPPAAAIASAHPLATEAGFEVLDAGGNAFDAAIALTAALAVAEPYSSGLGGGGFWLIHRAADGRQVMLDGRERAPLEATRDMYLDEDGGVTRTSLDGPLSAGIPGVPAALVHLAEHYGRLPLARSLQPAIRIARAGFEVTPHYRRMAAMRLHQLRRYPSTATLFLKNGEPYLIVKNGKGGKTRRVSLGSNLKKHLKEFLKWKEAAGEEKGEDAPVFCSAYKRRVSK